MWGDEALGEDLPAAVNDAMPRQTCKRHGMYKGAPQSYQPISKVHGNKNRHVPWDV